MTALLSKGMGHLQAVGAFLTVGAQVTPSVCSRMLTPIFPVAFSRRRPTSSREEEVESLMNSCKS